MNDMLWIPLALATTGTLAACLMSLLSNRNRNDHKGNDNQDANDGIESLRPKTYADEGARKRLPYLMMEAGGYDPSEIRLTLRQSDF